VLGSCRKLGGTAEHLIVHREKYICLLSFECKSPHVIERCSNMGTKQRKRDFFSLSFSLVGQGQVGSSISTWITPVKF